MTWTCKCKCGLYASVCNNKQYWNDDKCRCECKELVDKGVYNKGYIWNPSTCQCECDNSCNVYEYFDYESVIAGKKLVDKLVEECKQKTKKLAKITLAEDENKHKCSSWSLHMLELVLILFTTNTWIVIKKTVAKERFCFLGNNY